MADNVPKTMTPSAFTPFGGEFDQLFNRMVRAWSFGFLEPAPNGQLRALHSAGHAPKVEVQENGKTYTITVELPGVEQKDVKVLVEDDVLPISGEKHVERSDEKTHYTERSYGSFTRASPCPRMPTATASRPTSPRACLPCRSPRRRAGPSARGRSKSSRPDVQAMRMPAQAAASISSRPGMT